MNRGAQLGHIVSEETRRKIGDANRGKKRTEEINEKNRKVIKYKI